jgi:hypothetical protein
MKFRATEDEIIEIGLNAINASKPVGLGAIVFSDKVYTKSDLTLTEFLHGLSIDYFQGRMVKLHIKSHGEGIWSTCDDPPKWDYQSWWFTYPTYFDLVKSAIPFVVLI